MKLSRIGINALFLQPGLGGVEVYTRRLLTELVEILPNVDFQIFVNRHGKQLLSQEAWASEVTFVTHPLLGVRGARAITELSFLGPLADIRRLDLLHSLGMFAPLMMRIPNLVTIYDTIWLKYPDQHSPWTMRLWRTAIPRVARRADRVITISQTSAQLLAQRLGIARDKIDISLLGAGTLPAPTDTEFINTVRARYQLDSQQLILTVAQKRPHKNLIRLIRALALVAKNVADIKLILVGPPTAHDQELYQLAQALGVKKNLTLLSYVPQAELEALYACADCFVLPSLEEGFGLPVLEAQARDIPVACSRGTALAEIAGEGALLFDPNSEVDIARAITAICTDPRRQQTLCVAGKANQARFRWKKTAEDTVESYEKTLYRYKK